MDEQARSTNPPGWFTIAAVAALLFEAFGAYTYLVHVTADPNALPIDQRDMVLAMPVWMTAAYGIAVWVGLAGALLLLMRRRLAVPLLAVSLLAAVVQFSALLIDPAMRNLVGSDDLLAPFLIILVCYGIWHFATVARKSGWLR